jgi:hypothetical protein
MSYAEFAIEPRAAGVDLETNQENHKNLSFRLVWVREEMAHTERMMMGSSCLTIGLSFIGVNLQALLLDF